MKLKIEEIRANHINENIEVDGKVIQMLEVRPQVVNAKFECPSCGTIIDVLQTDKKFKEPIRCSCGRESKFKLLSKIMIDTQRLIIEDLDTIHRENCKHRISIFLKEDSCSYENQEKMLPGKKINVKGILKEKEVGFNKSGGISVIFDLVIDSKEIINID